MVDINPSLVKLCDVLAEIICNASYLKCDDVCLKSEPTSNRICTLYEDATHHVLQYHNFAIRRAAMLSQLCKIEFNNNNNNYNWNLYSTISIHKMFKGLHIVIV